MEQVEGMCTEQKVYEKDCQPKEQAHHKSKLFLKKKKKKVKTQIFNLE